MDKNKEESNPTDGTQWLEAYRQEKEWGEPHQWRLEELTFIKLELQTFFADEEKNQIPQEKLNQISEARRQMPRALYSPNLIEKMEQELDALEIPVYQYLLPPERYGVVTQSFPQVKSQEEWKPNLMKEFLGRLRQEFSTLPDKTTRLRTPIGRILVAGVKKTDGKSWKSTAVVGAYILNVYDLFKTFYLVSGRGYNKHKEKKNPKAERGHFPFALIRDITAFFSQEFPPWLSDLTTKDVISRIQYGEKRKFQREIHPPND